MDGVSTINPSLSTPAAEVPLSPLELSVQRKLAMAGGGWEAIYRCTLTAEELAAYLGFTWESFRRRLEPAGAAQRLPGLLNEGKGRSRLIFMGNFLKQSQLDAI